MARPGDCVHCGRPIHCEHDATWINDHRNPGQHVARVLTEDGIVDVVGQKAAVENHIAFVKRNQGN